MFKNDQWRDEKVYESAKIVNLFVGPLGHKIKIINIAYIFSFGAVDPNI